MFGKVLNVKPNYDEIIGMAIPGIVADNNEKIIWINDKFTKLTGYTKESILGKTIDILMTDEYKRGHSEYFKSFMKSSRRSPDGMGRTFPLKKADGTIIQILIRLTDFSHFLGGKQIAAMFIPSI